MKKEQLQKSLSNIAIELMKDNIESMALCATTKDGRVMSVYDISEDGSAFGLVGSVKVLGDRITLGLMDIPEIGLDDDE